MARKYLVLVLALGMLCMVSLASATAVVTIGGVNCAPAGLCSSFAGSANSRSAFFQNSSGTFSNGATYTENGFVFTAGGGFNITQGSNAGSTNAAPGFYEGGTLLDATNYITTPEIANQSLQGFSITLPIHANYFGLYWSTIDSYNQLTFHLSDGSTESWNGTQILALISGSVAGQTSAYINFNFGQLSITSVDVTSTNGNYAFEFDNVTAATPEPASMILLGTGLLSLAGSRKWFTRK